MYRPADCRRHRCTAVTQDVVTINRCVRVSESCAYRVSDSSKVQSATATQYTSLQRNTSGTTSYVRVSGGFAYAVSNSSNIKAAIATAATCTHACVPAPNNAVQNYSTTAAAASQQ
eukprot:15463-Heterococcus_DN1.PRE.3